MNNPVTGEKEITLAGNKLTLRYTWGQLSAIEAEFGEAPNLFNLETLAKVCAIGIRDQAWTAERIMEESPPLVPLIRDVEAALQWAYFGAEPIPESAEKKRPPQRDGLFMRLMRRLRLA